MTGAKSVTEAKNMAVCGHNHLFNPCCKENGTIKKIIAIIFHVLTLGSVLAAYQIYKVVSSAFSKNNTTPPPPAIDPNTTRNVDPTKITQVTSNKNENNVNEDSDKDSRSKTVYISQNSQTNATTSSTVTNPLLSAKTGPAVSKEELSDKTAVKPLASAEKAIKESFAAIPKGQLQKMIQGENPYVKSHEFLIGVTPEQLIELDFSKVHSSAYILEMFGCDSKGVFSEEGKSLFAQLADNQLESILKKIGNNFLNVASDKQKQWFLAQPKTEIAT